MAEQRYRPEYICWHENDFMADLYVSRRLTPHQRLMYRSLCQAAMFCSTRPYLPDDDEQLAWLADADSVEHWQANKDAVMKKFFKTEHGWGHKRILSDWEKINSTVAARREAGRKGGTANAKQEPSTSSTNNVNGNVNENENENPLGDNDIGGASVSQRQDTIPDTTTPASRGMSGESVLNTITPQSGDITTQASALVDLLYSLLKQRINNGESDLRIHADYATLWFEDMVQLLSKYDCKTCERIIRASQGGRWKKYSVRGEGVLKNADKIHEQLTKHGWKEATSPSWVEHREKKAAEANKSSAAALRRRPSEMETMRITEKDV